MAVRYHVSTWNSSTAPEAREFREVKKLNAALDETWRQIYAMCAADGALDTERAHRLLREFNAMQTDFEHCHPLSRKRRHSHYFNRKFVLRTDGAGDLQHVHFVAIRDDR